MPDDQKICPHDGAALKCIGSETHVQLDIIPAKVQALKTSDEKYQARQQQSQPIIDKLKNWFDKSLSQVPPKTALGKALYYLDSQWLRLKRVFTELPNVTTLEQIETLLPWNLKE